MTTVSSITDVSTQTPRASDREQLGDAARKFEAIFIRQMLAAARKTDFGGDLLSSEGLDTFRQMQDEQFADIAGKSGAFGLAAMIEAQLARYLPPQEG